MDLTEVAAKLVYKPLAFVKVAFPWGDGLLRDHEGPDEWQVRILKRIGDEMLDADSAV